MIREAQRVAAEIGSTISDRVIGARFHRWEIVLTVAGPETCRLIAEEMRSDAAADWPDVERWRPMLARWAQRLEDAVSEGDFRRQEQGWRNGHSAQLRAVRP